MVAQNQRKKITVATTISASGSVKSGGSNVMSGLYGRMSEYFDIQLIYLAPYTEKYKSARLNSNLVEITIPKTLEHDKQTRALATELKASTLYDVGIIYYLKYTPEYYKELSYSIRNSDVVIVDRPYLYDAVKKFINGRPVIQRSHNIEYYFRKSNIPESIEQRRVLGDLFDAEKECCNQCDINFSCSELDMKTMIEMYKTDKRKIVFMPNGVDCDSNPFISFQKRRERKKIYRLDKRKIAVFIGGGHRPNVEACEVIIKVAAYCSDMAFVIMGDVCNHLVNMKRTANVILVGNVSEDTRKFIFSVADVALNPMFSGSGSNVKMFDYMSMGVPVISTLFGARGISDSSGIILANTIEEIIKVINEFKLEEREEAILKNRNMVIEQYDWRIIADKAKDCINKVLG